MSHTWIHVTISILLVIRQNKHILLIRIHSFDALLLQEKLLFLPFFLESKFIHQMGQAWIHMIIYVLFVIRHYKNILLNCIHDFDALVLLNEENLDSHDNLYFFMI